MSSLKAMLRRHEGERLKAYRCPAGKLTIGVGRNVEEFGITREESDMLLENDIARIRGEASRFPWFAGLNPARQDAIIDMMFIGRPRFLEFERMHAALDRGDYAAAADEMLASRWARQVGGRAVELAGMMRTGTYASSA